MTLPQPICDAEKLETPGPAVQPAGCDIAIVGMACMFPESPDLRRYWQNILRRIDCIREVPEHRWDSHHFFDEDRFARDKVYSKWGGFLGDIRFDPMKWKIPPASLLSIDPIQLLSLEVAAQAIEDAGYDKKEYSRERTGVIFACAGSHDVGSDYAFRTMLQHYLPRVKDLTPELRQKISDDINATLPEWTEDSFPGFLMNVIAGRIANRFDFGGPNYVVDAACAASLAAMHAALGQLRLGTVDAMLVGGADGTNNPFCYMSFAKTHALSPRGRSRPFDNSADGIALGEGIAAVMLRRLADAERDGDKIYAVIKGIGASSDGRNRSMTAPHPPGQILAMKRAYDDAGIPAATVSLVEAHGTGTAVGDSTEITSLHTLFSQATQDEQYAAVGSVKSQIGHTKTCAGMASLVKTTLALKHRVLPPTINVETPNENVDFRHSPFFINTETRPWFEELGEHPRRAGVSAFGFGGTNFHVVMEEYAGQGGSSFDLDLSPRAAEVFLWRRATRTELVAALENLQSQWKDVPTDDLAQLAYSVHRDESQRSQTSEVSEDFGSLSRCRLGIVAATMDEFRTKLNKAIEALQSKDTLTDPTGIYYSEAAPVAAEKVAFLYPGQGSQAVNMLRDLVVVNRWAHELFTSTNRALTEFFPIALTRMAYPPPAFTPEEDEERKQRLNDTQVAQPALGLVEVFATKLLARYGIVPGAAAGHSYGEYAALYAAGSLSEKDLLTVSAHRGRVAAYASQTMPGAMAAVQAGAEATRKALAELNIPADLANLNAPDQTIIAGSVEVITRAGAELTAHGLKTKRIPVTAAFHTAALAPAAKTLGLVLEQTKLESPQIPVYSNTLAARYPTENEGIRELLGRHIVEPVRFEEEMRQMRADGIELFVEVGPGRVLTGLVGRIFSGESIKTLTLDASGRDGVVQFGHVLAQAFAWGLPVQLASAFEGRGLKDIGAAEFQTQSIKDSQPKKSDWILSVHGAKPVTPLRPRKNNPGDGLRAKFGGKAGTSGGTAGTLPKDAFPPVNGTSRKADTNPQTVVAGEPAKSVAVATAAPSRRLGTPAPTISNRVANLADPHPAPAPAPLPAPGSPHRTAVASNGHHENGHSQNGKSNGHHPHNGSAIPLVASTATNGVHRPAASAPMAAAAAAPSVTSVPVSIPGSAVPLAPCLPLVSELQSLSSVPAARPVVSMNSTPCQEAGQSMSPAAAQMILQSQALMMQMLDLQKWQQQVALRFMESHQQLVQGYSTGAALPTMMPMIATALPVPQTVAVAAPVAEVATAPQPMAPAPAPTPMVAAPAPAMMEARSAPVAVAVAPKPVAVAAAPKPMTPVNRLAAAPIPVAKSVAVAVQPEQRVSTAPSRNGHTHEVPAPHVIPAAPAARTASADDEALPTVEEFQTDLLEAVSDRTGYPIEMLDLTLPMESGLGIDSIKTVEIFSNLKRYHPYFQQEDQDEEEALKEFTKLKTLGDIISAYELRYQAVTSGGAAPQKIEDNGAAVERYTLEAVEAASSNGEKKSTLASR